VSRFSDASVKAKTTVAIVFVLHGILMPDRRLDHLETSSALGRRKRPLGKNGLAMRREPRCWAIAKSCGGNRGSRQIGDTVPRSHLHKSTIQDGGKAAALIECMRTCSGPPWKGLVAAAAGNRGKLLTTFATALGSIAGASSSSQPSAAIMARTFVAHQRVKRTLLAEHGRRRHLAKPYRQTVTESCRTSVVRRLGGCGHGSDGTVSGLPEAMSCSLRKAKAVRPFLAPRFQGGSGAPPQKHLRGPRLSTGQRPKYVGCHRDESRRKPGRHHQTTNQGRVEFLSSGYVSRTGTRETQPLVRPMAGNRRSHFCFWMASA
jgi:hypothetical protein